jgi:hypothetical protein
MEVEAVIESSAYFTKGNKKADEVLSQSDLPHGNQSR